MRATRTTAPGLSDIVDELATLCSCALTPHAPRLRRLVWVVCLAAYAVGCGGTAMSGAPSDARDASVVDAGAGSPDAGLDASAADVISSECAVNDRQARDALGDAADAAPSATSSRAQPACPSAAMPATRLALRASMSVAPMTTPLPSVRAPHCAGATRPAAGRSGIACSEFDSLRPVTVCKNRGDFGV